MNKKHYIAMGGLHGYLPSHCDVYPTYNDAVESLVELYSLGKKRKKELQDNSYLELYLHGDKFPFICDGNEYCEITECNCDNPAIHSDSYFELPDDWQFQ